jgi:DNA-binding LytR/AlgR family response regulator
VADKQAEQTGNSNEVTVIAAPDHAKHEFIFVKTEYRMQKVMFNDIHYIEGMKDYLRIVCPDVRIMTLTNFKNMLEMLPNEQFCRIHKSYIINLSKIQSIEKSHVIVLNERLPIGDSFRKAFFELLQKLKLINPKHM